MNKLIFSYLSYKIWQVLPIGKVRIIPFFRLQSAVRMKARLLAVLLITCPLAAHAQSGELQRLYVKAIEAQQQGDNARFYDLILQAHAIHPYHQGILYQAGIAAALNNKKEEAIRYLKEAILIQADFTLYIPELQSLKQEPAFQQLLQLQKDASRPIVQSDTAFILKDRSLHPESITSEAKEGVFYLGSIHKRKIVKVDHGKVQELTQEGQDGLGSVFGIKTDKKNGVLWVSTSPMQEMKNFNALLPSAVFKYDLKTGRLLKKFLPENPALELVLGDLTLSPSGEVYTSDSKNNLIFRVNESTGKLEQVYSSEEFSNIQGITFSDNGQYLFIADYIKGIFRLEVATFHLILLPRSIDASLKGIDGLTFYNNSLIAIQNGVKPMRVTRYILNKEMDRLISFSILDRGHPAFGEPTSGCVSQDAFYYVANSQWNGYTEDHQIKPEGSLQDIVILKQSLDR